MASYNKVRHLIHRDTDPYLGLELLPRFEWGFNSFHPIFKAIIDYCQPTLIVEVGSFVGESAIHMAKIVRNLGLDCEIVCVDTWCSYDWTEDSHYERHKFKNGRPMIYEQFMSNVVHEGMENIITPFPTDSVGARDFMKKYNIHPNVVYIDAGHEKEECLRDIDIWYELLNRHGNSCIFGDDYGFPPHGVDRAVEEFKLLHKIFDHNLQIFGEKWLSVLTSNM